LSCKHNEIRTGTIISDLSDHFPTFVCAGNKAPKHAEKSKSIRDFNSANMNRFRALLAASDWNNVLESQCVNTSYAAFWSNYSKLYEICFPLRKIRSIEIFKQKIKFMTEGLLNSRRTKQQLYEKLLLQECTLEKTNFCLELP
jgi:hypothetical protein